MCSIFFGVSLRLGRSILGANQSGEMVTVILRFLQSPTVAQRHLFFGPVTHLHRDRFAIPFVHFNFAQLDLQRPDHSAI